MSIVVEAVPRGRKNTKDKKAAARVRLKDLFAGCEEARISGRADVELRSVAYDSRKVQPGGIFFALRGAKSNGLEFVANALRAGAIAVAAESARPESVPAETAWVELQPGSDRRMLAQAAANFYRHPADALKLVGVTGTNGKTTTTFLVDAILRAAGFTSGLIGTTGYRTPAGEKSALNTTPESLDLQEMFAEIRDAGGTHATLEASSHALAMDRLSGCHFAVAIFTNLTRDHLDYHKTFEEYFAAKRRLFEGTGAGAPDAAVINTDDPYGARLDGFAKKTLTYGLKGSPSVTAKKVSLGFGGLQFTAQTPTGKIQVDSSLVGRINVYNILAAIGAAVALEIPSLKIEEGIARLQGVPGRFERIDEGQPFLVVVDYAHTDDALRNLIATARDINAGARIITLFGAGGERDRAKRPMMGDAAGSASDMVVLTSDNPRSEDPLLIINDVVVGLQKANASYRIEPDREKAIGIAFDEARAGDIVLLAGKGHETYQVLRDGPVPFDDREKARAILRRKGYSRTKLDAR
ncbi:MAG TPA: UDP-N-acetylmuramoyl-L-alanyl-D-glutamate--2,6-diaminopimelate ligase [Candidatus Acidoferrales bacterium]|nr:UDP-N-acetylmuramoyl-L-alanyl-D-glutamate--2,6-diaminopimelate ligase [Candidatus Acidoferrales bacterium]